ncbi:tail fiber domain-containing protein (plasmid) [Pseudomonas marginalis]|uniref:tail fiber domain-containing protein n=1 Tax=Pseudomonas marginalis TaxID=298 RepID=UPI00386FBEE5
MSAGTLTLTNNSAAVGGSGTAFTTELAAGDFILVIVGGVPYTLPVKTINSNTSLTLVSNFTGPTQSGSAWSAVPRVAMNLVTAALVAQSAEALRGLNYDKQNWQQVFSVSGNVTVKLPDGSSFTGPAWGGITASLDAKMNKDQNLNDLTNKTTARNNLGLGNAAVANVGTSSGTVAAGNDSRLGTVNGMSGGIITGNVALEATAFTLSAADVANSWFFPIIFRSGQGTNVNMAQIYHSNQGININTGLNTGTSKFNTFSANGNYSCQGNITCVALTQTSDRDKKENIENIDDALSKIQKLNGVTYNFIDTGMPSAGVMAQELLEVLPEAIGSCFDEHDEYETIEEEGQDGELKQITKLVHARDESKRTYTVEYSGVVALCVEAIKELAIRNSINESEIAELKARLEAVDGLKD